MPPESSCGISRAAPRRPDRVQLREHEVAHQPLRQPGVLAQREGDVLEHVEVGEQRAVLEQHAHLPAQRVELPAVAGRATSRPSTTTLPASGRSWPVMSRSSVVLPVPLGPMIAVTAPRRIPMSSPRKIALPPIGVVDAAQDRQVRVGRNRCPGAVRRGVGVAHVVPGRQSQAAASGAASQGTATPGAAAGSARRVQRTAASRSLRYMVNLRRERPAVAGELDSTGESLAGSTRWTRPAPGAWRRASL